MKKDTTTLNIRRRRLKNALLGLFIEDFIAHMTTPGRNRDPYSEIYIRRWFENYSRGFPPNGCADLNCNAMSGRLGRMAASSGLWWYRQLRESAYQGLGLAIEHQNQK